MRNLTFALIVALILPSAALAVGTSHWTHTSEADFKAGTLKDVVATNLGDLKLSRASKNLLGQDARVSAVYAMAQTPDGTVYAATGPEGVLLRITGEQVATAAELGDNTSLFSLLVDAKGNVLVGTGGESGQIFRIDTAGGKPHSVFRADGVQYVWAMTQTPDGTIYAATGPNGQLFEISADGTSKVVLDTEENNLLCVLAGDGDLLHVGSDPNGLVYRFNRKTGETFVVYDAAETEVTALARDKAGNLYAATAQATEPTGVTEGEPMTEQVGRPERQQQDVPIPSERPADPAPPEVPDPSPGDPLPIPRDSGRGGVKPNSMLILAQEIGAQDPDEKKPDDDKAKQDLAAAARIQHEPVGAIGGEPAPEGNAIYRIDKDGFVTEVFRQPVLVYCMTERDGNLLVGTGTGGEVYQINPAAEETSVLAKVDPKDVLSMLPTKDGRLMLGLANSGDVAVLTPGFASTGAYTSPVLDAGQISRFGKVRLRGTLPEGSTLMLSTRSSNVAGATDAGWSAWSEPLSAAEFVQIPSPPARFLQYRLTFTSVEGKQTPAVEEVDVAYQMPNLAPKITSVTVTPGEVSSLTGEANPDSQKYAIAWEASDPNDDSVVYGVYYRAGSRSPWILMKDKLTSTSHEWETRAVADGTYQVKVEASDARANPPGGGKVASRVSDPVLVDNTAPAIGDLKSAVAGARGSGEVTIEMRVVDRSGTVASASYAVDSGSDWQTVLPSDSIADSPEETYRFTVPGLSPGQHQVTVRALDKRGNPTFESVTVTVK